MKFEVGMYVRTKHNGIKQINALYSQAIFTDTFIRIENEQIINASHNIIDLIEVGDYVNGKKVIRKWEEPFGEFVGQIFIQLEGEETIPTMRKIETIVTKEQFESISYKIGD